MNQDKNPFRRKFKPEESSESDASGQDMVRITRQRSDSPDANDTSEASKPARQEEGTEADGQVSAGENRSGSGEVSSDGNASEGAVSPKPVLEDGALPGRQVREVARRLIRLTGEQPIRALAGNPALHPPGWVSQTDPGASPEAESWLAVVLRSYVGRAELSEIGENLAAFFDEREAFEKQIEELQARRKQVEEVAEEKQVQHERRLADLKAEMHEARSKLQSSIQVENVAELMLERDEHFAPLTSLLAEAAAEPSPQLAPFCIAFLRGLRELKPVLEDDQAGEDVRIDRLDRAVRSLLDGLSGLYVPQRRALLGRLAQAMSERLEHHEFLSPEDERHIDPARHNASGLGGSTIREAKSFTVVGRPNGQTVRYADVLVDD